jgi:DNA-binding FrmR family transcriptional regulator
MVKKEGCLTKECKNILLTRIKRIQGQVQGIEKMVQGDRYCVDLLQQVSSVHEALRGVGKEIMRNYLEQCVTKAILSERKDKQEAIYKELMDVIYKYAK